MSEQPTQTCLQCDPCAARPHPLRRVLFASAHSIVDFSNGAAVASLDVLRALGSAGFDCQAFCTSRLDFREDVLLETLIVQSGEPLKVRPSVCPSGHARLLHTRRHQVPIAAAPKGATPFSRTCQDMRVPRFLQGGQEEQD